MKLSRTERAGVAGIDGLGSGDTCAFATPWANAINMEIAKIRFVMSREYAGAARIETFLIVGETSSASSGSISLRRKAKSGETSPVQIRKKIIALLALCQEFRVVISSFESAGQLIESSQMVRDTLCGILFRRLIADEKRPVTRL